MFKIPDLPGEGDLQWIERRPRDHSKLVDKG